MKKFNLFLIFCVGFQWAFSQAQEANLIGRWFDEDLVVGDFVQGAYNECWGVYQNGAEVGIIGSTLGTHFIDLRDPKNPTEIKSAFIPGADQGSHIVHRDYHHLDNYLYAVCDEGASTLQVIDISGLPDTAFTVYDSELVLSLAHNIFIDSTSQRLYACSANTSSGAIPLAVLDISVPNEPKLIAAIHEIEGTSITGLHDIYVRHDTTYLNVGNKGFYVADLSILDAIKLLGTLTNYPQQGYNHSGWLDEKGEYYYFADETHGSDMKVLPVSDFSDMEVSGFYDADSVNDDISIAHNLIEHCGYLYVSHYYNGLQIYDLTDQNAPERVFYYDTYPEPDEKFFAGAWGVFPLLPSGIILLSDIQRGLFVFEAITSQCNLITDGNEPKSELSGLDFWPNPGHAGGEINVVGWTDSENILSYALYTTTGVLILNKTVDKLADSSLTMTLKLPPQLSNGFYFLKIKTSKRDRMLKLVIVNDN